jgi:hypothetical protein
MQEIQLELGELAAGGMALLPGPLPVPIVVDWRHNPPWHPVVLLPPLPPLPLPPMPPIRMAGVER